MALSAKPSRAVQVKIKLQIRGAPCYRYTKKLKLAQELYEFDPSQYDVPQNVIIRVNRLNAPYYEGNFYATLEHTIITDDADFKSAFLRPVTVTLQDDTACADHARQYEPHHGIRKCGCLENFFIEANDPYFCDSSTTCQSCPKGMICAFQQNLTKALLEPHFYRTHDASINVVECPEPKTQCAGEATSGDDLCAEGHEGMVAWVALQGGY